jgi:glycosyltransferase involved in cell wall biosynthesis
MNVRVLLAHNFYRSSEPSGEAQVLASERELLERHGHVTAQFLRHNDEIVNDGVLGAIRGAFSTPWNPFAAMAIRKSVNEFSPDIVHVHNTFPLISPSIFHAVGSRAARVLTLHNYRLFCPAAIPMRNGDICTKCIDKHSVKPALRHGCYRNSRIATTPLALGVALHRSMATWKNQVDAFIVLTEFQRDLMIEAGLPSELVHIKPNFYSKESTVLPWNKRSDRVVFVGRLSQEKGLESLLEAWIMWGASAPELQIIGDGPLREGLERKSVKHPQVPIRFLGQVNAAAAQEEIARARLLVLPSLCFEGFPMVLIEAFTFGTPVAVSSVGPLPSIVTDGENGVTFSPGDPRSLLQVVRKTWESKSELDRLANGARHSYETQYSATKNYNLLVEIYQKATEVSRRRSA